MAQKDKVKELVGRGLNSYHTKALQQIDRIEKKNKEQNHKISILSNELDNDYLTKTEEGSVISLEHSKEGMVYLDELQGNTLVNYCTDGSNELTLNGDIDVEGTFVTTTEGVDNGKVDVMCEGSTLINLISKNWSYGTFETKNNRECLKIEKTLGSAQYVTNVKSGSTYTLIYDYISTELINGTTNPFGRLHLTLSNQGGWVYDVPVKNFGSNNTQFTRSISVFTIPTDKQFTTLNVSGVLRDIDGTVWIDKEILLLEGDWSNKEIPPYFEGMKSVGQDDENGHKIEILSRNNGNLFDKNDITLGAYLSRKHGNTVKQDNSCYCNKFIEVKENDIIYIHPETIALIVTYDENKNHIGEGYEGREPYTIQKGVKYIRVSFYNRNHLLDSDVLSVGFSNDTVVSKPYVLNKKEILLNEPLRGLPSGIKDRFVKIGGKPYIERNCGCKDLIVVSGSRWEDNYVADGMIGFHGILSMGNNYNGSGSVDEIAENIVCDKLPSIGRKDLKQTTYDAIIRGNTYIGITVKADKLETQDFEGFKKYINSLNAKFIYNLATPIYEPLEIDPTINTYTDTTHISNNSIIPCNMKIKNSGYNAIIKPSTLYTVALDTNKSGTIGMNLGGAKVTTTNNVAKITTPATLTDDSLRLYGKDINASKVRLLEGDKTNWIPSYFEGMKSSFEDKFDATDNTYKMEILSNNENLFNASECILPANHNFDIKINNNNGYTLTSKINGGGWIYTSKRLPFKLKPNTRYEFSCNISKTNPSSNPCIRLYELGKNKDYGFLNSTGKFIFTTPTVEVEKIELLVYSSMGNAQINTGDIIEYNNIKISEVANKSFVEKKCDKIQFSSIEPLRKWDRFIFKDNKLMIERNSRSAILNGSEDWRNEKTRFWVSKNDIKLNGEVFSNEYPSSTYSELYYGKINLIALHNTHKQINVRDINVNDIEKFKEKLINNPITVVYQLAEPKYEEIPFELQKIILEGYENGTLFIDTNIPPTSTVRYAGETPIVKATKLNKTEVLNNTNDINDNIVPYLMDMDYRVVCLQLQSENINDGVSMARLFGGAYEMLQRDIQSKRYSVDEYRHRLDAYLDANKITEEEYNKLGDMLNE